MRKDLSQFLSELSLYLKHIDSSQKIDFLYQKKQDILKYLESHPDSDIEDIYGKFLRPKKIAEKYCLENGYKFKGFLNDQSSWSIGKGIAYVFGIGALTFLCFILILFFKFTPLFEMQDSKISLLGGSIVLDDLDDFLSNVNVHFNNGKIYEKSIELEKGKFKKIDLKFSNTKLNIKKSEDNTFSYQCQASDDAEVEIKEETLFFDYEGLMGSVCEIRVPQDIDLYIKANNGMVGIEKIASHLNLQLKNGSVSFKADSNYKYNYNLRVDDGNIAKFENSNDQTAYKIIMRVNKGAIEP